MSNERILVVDDEPGVADVLSILLTRARYQVETAWSGEQALDLFDRQPPDLVITDLTMPGIDGIELLRRVRQRAVDLHREIPVIVLTAYGTVQNAVSAMKEGAFHFVSKPFQKDELLSLVEKALKLTQLERDNVRLRQELHSRYQLGELVGSSPRMQEVYGVVRKVMGSRISCLITGESGTGKEVVARAIHHGSERRDGPFVPVNCGAIPETLIESELFGYRRGAFTGAVRDNPGFFASANGGTLFLDEIGEMPLSAQVKVLRALAQRKITAVGANNEQEVDVRVLAATNRNLQAEVRGGRFREDLFYRLAVVEIQMPPLRERAEDVPDLARHFVERFAREYGSRVVNIAPDALERLKAYAWPGNVRELGNVIERAVALETGTVITVASLPERVLGEFAPGSAERDIEVLPATGIDLEQKIAQIEKHYIQRAMDVAKNNRTKAANLLGLSLRQIRYKLDRYGIDPDGAASD